MRRARLDERLGAQVIQRRPLRYDAGADPAADVPAHVRAASSLGWLGERLAVVQDDANIVALLDVPTGAIDAVLLPWGHGQKRLFDDDRGNRAFKLDLEACITTHVRGAPMLVAFGSGSSEARESVALVGGGDPREVRLVAAHGLYQRLRGEPAFAGSQLNIEGAVLMAAGRLRLFQRGNGAPSADADPTDATCELDWAALWSYLLAGGSEPPPPVGSITRYELGELDGVRLTFTDATRAPQPGGVLYLASAEDCPDALRDGTVVGTAVGIIDERGRARWAPLVGTDGTRVGEKAEGIALIEAQPDRALLVTDPDDPSAAAELIEVRLTGPWWE